MAAPSITVRCGACGGTIGATSTEHQHVSDSAPEVFVTSRKRIRPRRGASSGDSSPLREDVLPIAGSKGDWNMRLHPTPVHCPARDCKAVYDLARIATAVADARRRGKTSTRVHHPSGVNL